ncbi:type III PLP-dependent enzyme [Streptomyces sp. 8N706]|uniref:type III PLP-dependent enzyme n=1 Tax=Streptomyces sp. 8N706 TaxID=3457416 RepID=UPI003FD4FA1B
MLTSDQLEDAVLRHGTPLYVYDLQEVRERVKELRNAIPEKSRLLYSLKANPLPELVRTIAAEGCWAEVSSVGEIDVALESGVPPERVLCTGPGKTEAEIRHALTRGIVRFSCESSVEMARLDRLAESAGRTVELLLRLQPTMRPPAGLSMADGRQFGFEETEAVQACKTARGSAHLRLRGFHVYLGSQVPDVTALLEGFTFASAVIARVATEAGVDVEVADLGGGFPWPYAAEGEGVPLADLVSPLSSALSGGGLSGTAELWFESGRRLCASAGALVTTVVDVKPRADGRCVVVTDAGINALGGMSGLGRTLRPRAAFRPLTGPGHDGVAATPVDVVGPSCTPLDRLTVGTEMEMPAVGDQLVVPNVGAYGPTASLTAFLSRPAPAEVVYDGDSYRGAWQIRGGHRALGTAGPTEDRPC